MSKHVLLLNGKVYTMDRAHPQVEAVAIRGSRILAVGSRDDLTGVTGSDGWRVIDLGGKAVLPGFTDCHVHFLSYALESTRLSLKETDSLDDILAAVKESADRAEPGSWILGRGWSDSKWKGVKAPSKELLDHIAPQHPVALTKKDGHVVWVNSQALKQAGIDEDTPEPAGGVIERDENTGQPSGIFKEEAMSLIGDAIPLPDAEERQQALRNAISQARGLGLTGIHDCDGSESLSDYQEMLGRGELGLRVFMMIPRQNLAEAVKIGVRSGFGNERLRIGNVKIFSDGTLGSQTAQMLEPFSGQPDNLGVAAIPQGELEDVVGRAAKAGIASSIHAIGDKANHRVLDVFAKLRREGTGAGLRHRIEHAQLLHTDDMSRFKELDIIASMQPIHATSDIDLAQQYWADRTDRSYAWRSLLSAGARLAFGSDAPVESMDPLGGIHAAVTRQRPDGNPQGGWHPEQRLTVAEAVHGYTVGAAYASGEETEKGSISAGKLADLVVLSKDIFEVPAAEILDTRVVATVFDGRIVYGDESL